MKSAMYRVKLVKDNDVEYNVKSIASPGDLLQLAKVFDLEDEPVEKFCMIALNTKNKPLAHFVVHVGTVNSSLVHPRDVFQRAILCNASAIVLVHNHPSGVVKPSKDDIETTNRIKQGGDILGIKVLDHLILGEGDDYYSFVENDLI